MKSTKTFRVFRKIAMAEGVSFLVLLLIAMPLKYAFDLPLAVKIVGYAHGFLFVTFMILAFTVKAEYSRTWGWGVKAFIASLVPFGTFYMEKHWKEQERQFANS